MRDLVRSLRMTGTPVPVPWAALAQIVKPRSGNLMSVVAAPGVGKSMFSLQWAAGIGRPALYVSLDTTLVDQAVRLVSLQTGNTIDAVSEGHDEDQEGWIGRWTPVLEGFDIPLRFVDNVAGVEGVEEVIAGDTEYWGEPPNITFVDNVADLLEAEEGAAEYNRIFRQLRDVARDTNTFIVALHHLRRKPPGNKRRCAKCGEGAEDEDQSSLPVHASDILYAGDRAVQFLLGMWRPDPGKLRIGVLKNRMGLADPNGKVGVSLTADLQHAKFTDNTIATYMDGVRSNQ